MSCPGLLIVGDAARFAERWVRAAELALPKLDVFTPESLTQAHEPQIRYALVWGAHGALLSRLEGLKLVVSVGAGVDHLLDDPDFPRHIPLVRMVDPGLTQGMGDYLLMTCLMAAQGMVELIASQRARRWEPLDGLSPANCRVGLMGLGELGQHAAERLMGQGFQVSGWSRNRKTFANLKTYAGMSALPDFLSELDLLVLLLPLTPETQGLIDAQLLSHLKPSAQLINAGRGGLVKEEDLLAALDSGRLAAAILDVFVEEPLPEVSRFWEHPRVLMTPHIASVTQPESGVQAVARAVSEYEAGKPLSNRVDLARGY